jgi:hypothetical protein
MDSVEFFTAVLCTETLSGVPPFYSSVILPNWETILEQPLPADE